MDILSTEHKHTDCGVIRMCGDWRLHSKQVTTQRLRQLKKRFGIKCWDLETCPGPDSVSLDDSRKHACATHDQDRGIYIKAHHSKVILLIGHSHCAGNVVSDDEHRRQVLASIKQVRETNPDFAGKIVGYFYEYIDDQTWNLVELGEA